MHNTIEELDKAFDRLFPQAKKYELYRFIGGLFCLGQITFQNEENEQCRISSLNLAELAAELLLINRAELVKTLTKRSVKVNGEVIWYVWLHQSNHYK